MKTLVLDTKSCMKHILLSDSFDSLYLLEGEIITSNKFNIDGHICPAYFDEPPTDAFMYWRNLRDYCLQIIKGNKTPISFAFVFSFSAEMIADFTAESKLTCDPDSIQGLYFNMRFERDTLFCITGTSLKEFSLDKSIEHAFDEFARKFFINKDITVLSYE